MSHAVHLRKVVPEDNVHRQFNVEVQIDLFGTPLVVCRWGRIGNFGRVREHVCAIIEEAEALAARLVKTKQRRGYGAGGLGPSDTCHRPKTRARKPAATNRRKLFGHQLCLFDVDAGTPITFEQGDPCLPQHTDVPPPLPKSLTDLSTVTQQRRAPLAEVDRNRRLQVIIAMAGKRGMSLALGRAPAV